jgi:Protein of unknown function (DUF1800)
MRNQLQPYTGNFGRPELLHLLRRSLFGVKPSDLNLYANKTVQQVVSELLTFNTAVSPPIKTYTSAGDPALVDPTIPFGQTWVNDVIPPNQTIDPKGNRRASMRAWWIGHVCGQEPNLREKMVFFWHNHMPTEMLTVDNPTLIYRYLKLLRDRSLGNYRQFIHEMTLDGAMLIYLNGRLSTKTAPDENYARELQELFCIGKGSGSAYTEPDVQAAAKVLTGWTINTGTSTVPLLPVITFNLSRHDVTNKTFSAFYGNKVIQGVNNATGGQAEIGQLLDMLTSHPEHALYMCRRLYQFFVHHELTPDVEGNLIGPLAQIYRDNAQNPDQMKVVMQALLTSAYFYRPEIRGCMVKSPLDFCCGAIRTFGMTMPGSDKYEAQYKIWLDIHNQIKAQDFDFGEPPNVAGYPAYYQAPQFSEIWVDTASYPERKKTYERNAGTGYTTNATMYTVESRNYKATINWFNFALQFDTPEDPNMLIDQATELLFGLPVSQTVKDTLKTNFLLNGQSSDYYWTDIFLQYFNNPATTDPAAKNVPTILKNMFLDMQGAAEFHMC